MAKKKTQLTANIPPDMYERVSAECENNGWDRSIAMKIGLEYFLVANHEQRLALIKRHNQRSK